MGKISSFQIIYSNGLSVIYAGQTVTGCVTIDLKEPLKIKGIRMKYHGEMMVNFTDTKSKKRCQEGHVYFDHSEMVFVDVDQPIAAGHHEYPFSFSFSAPEILPSSFESRFGHVRYWCTAQLLLPMLSRDQSVKKPFSLVSIVDLNNEPLAFTPRERSKDVCFGLADRLFSCFKSGALTLAVRLDRCAFVPGELMVVHAQIVNHSYRQVRQVHAYIQQNVLYTTTKGGARFVKGEAKIAQSSRGTVHRSETQSWTDMIAIPPLPPTKLGGCPQIAVDYLFYMVLTMDNSNEVYLSIPIVIGTIPLQLQMIIQPSAPPLVEFDSFQAELPSAPPPPPTYQECIYTDEQMCTTSSGDSELDQSEIENKSVPSYKPLYPTYETLGRN